MQFHPKSQRAVGLLGQGGTGGGKAFEAPPQNSDQATLYSQELPAGT